MNDIIFERKAVMAGHVTLHCKAASNKPANAFF